MKEWLAYSRCKISASELWVCTQKAKVKVKKWHSRLDFFLSHSLLPSSFNSLIVPVFSFFCLAPHLGENVFGKAFSRHGSIEGSVAEWSARRTRNPAVPGSSPALATCWICAWSSRVQILGHACHSQLVAFCQLGFLILLCCIWIICF